MTAKRIYRGTWPMVAGIGNKIPGILVTFLALALGLAVSRGIYAQESDGELSGRVTDASGAPMPNVQVHLNNLASGATRVVTTNTEGFYAAPSLPPETYQMTVSASGFTTQVRTGVTLTVGAKQVINIVMEPGNTARTVRTSGAADPPSQTASTVSRNVSASTVRNSPLNGRDWTQLATLLPGIIGISTASTGPGRVALHGFGSGLSISGGRPEQNDYRLDGISINDYSNGAPGNVLGGTLGVDAVEQFSVLASNYPAEYGRTTGGVINAATRSGTNTFHGNVFEFLRNSALDARNFFDAKTPAFHRSQFGASAGGALQKSRAFYFVAYEGLRQSLGTTRIVTVPSAAARSGQLSTGAVTVDPVVAPFLKALFPLPNGRLLGKGDLGIYSFPAQQVATDNFITLKVDRKFSEKDSVSGTLMRDSSNYNMPDHFSDLLAELVSKRQVVTLHEQHIFGPGFLNAVRFGFNRALAVDMGVLKVLSPRVTDLSLSMVTGQFPGGIAMPGVSDFSGGPVASSPHILNRNQNFVWNSFEWGDDAFIKSGAHSLQFGAVAERMQENESALNGTDGFFTFSSLSALLTNRPRTFAALIPGSAAVFGMRQTLFGAYLQDEFRARRNLALDLGLRYEMTNVPTEAHGRVSNLWNLTDARPHLGSPFFSNPTVRNFEPRVGFTWDPSGVGKAALRGGFGVFDVLPLPYEFSLVIPWAAPFGQWVSSSAIPAGAFPTGAFRLLAGNPSALHATYVEQHPKRNYVMHWNLNVDWQLATDLVATAGYVGSRSAHQPFRADDFDTVLPKLTPAGYLYPPAATSQRLNPNFGSITGIVWQGNAFYDALELEITKRMSRGFQLHGSYTWSKSIDTSSVTVTGQSLTNALINPPFFDLRLNRGPSDFNVTQNLVFSYTWELPSPRPHSRIGGWTLSGWQLGGIYKASTGVPFTPFLGGDPLNTKLSNVTDVPNRVLGPDCGMLTNPGNPNHYIKTQCLTFPAPAGLLGNLGRNTLIGPGLADLDFSIIKNNRVRRISENFNAQFRAEFFNIFNRANFAPPTDNLTVFDQDGNSISSAGLITMTQTSSRQIQFALKLLW